MALRYLNNQVEEKLHAKRTVPLQIPDLPISSETQHDRITMIRRHVMTTTTRIDLYKKGELLTVSPDVDMGMIDRSPNPFLSVNATVGLSGDYGVRYFLVPFGSSWSATISTNGWTFKRVVALTQDPNGASGAVGAGSVTGGGKTVTIQAPGSGSSTGYDWTFGFLLRYKGKEYVWDPRIRTIPETLIGGDGGKYINIQILRGLNQYPPGSLLNIDNKVTEVNLWWQDDGSGRQQWELIPAVGYPGQYNIMINPKGSPPNGNSYLSAQGGGSSDVTLTQTAVTDDQRWALFLIDSNIPNYYNIKVMSTDVETGYNFLSCSSDGITVDLWNQDDNSGRQRWQLQ